MNSKIMLILVLAFMVMPAGAEEQKARVITFDGSWGEAGFSVVSSDKTGLVVSYSLPAVTLTPVSVKGESFSQVSIPGAMLPTNPGQPNLPGFGRFVAVPNDASVTVEVLEARTRTFDGIDVLPAAPIPLETETAPLPEKDPLIYLEDEVWPSEPVTLSARRQLRGVETRILGVTPFGYNPVARELTVYTDLRIRLTFEGEGKRFGTDRLRSRYWDPILERQLVNFEILPERYDSSRDYSGSSGVEYIIIVPDDPDFVSWGQALADFRQGQGISSQVFTVTDVGGNTATAIEAFLDDAYNTWPTAPVAVLFLGDYVNDGQPGGVTSPNNGGYVSDNVYADVDGDHLPDLVPARITARDATELSIMIGKVLGYEQSPPTDDGFYRNPMVACGFQTERWFQICTEIVRGFWEHELGKHPVRQYNVYSGSPDPGDPWSTNANTYMLVDYFGTAGLNYIPDTQPNIDWNSGSAAGINAGINAGCFILQHRDHGSEDGWGEPDYGTSDLTGLTNDLLPWVFSINCLTGTFNMSGECFAEVFHRMEGGALGITAATDVSYSFVNDTYVFGTYDCMWPEFDPGYPTTTRAVGLDNLRPAFGDASGKYFLEASNWPYNPDNKQITYYLFHSHADAFTTLYSEVPATMGVTHGAVLLAMMPFLTVTAPPGSVIALTRDGEILGVGDGTGAPVDISIPGQLPGPSPVELTVTLANHYRYEADVEVIPPSGPYVAFSNWSIDDSGGNGNGLLDAGETVDLTVTLKNYGIETATGVAAVLSTADMMVTVHADTVSYGEMIPDAVSDGNGVYVIELDVTCPDGQPLAFDLMVTADGAYNWESRFTLIGQSDPDVALDPATLEPSGFEGAVALETLNIANLGTRELEWEFVPGTLWISIDPVSGVVDPGGSEPVTVYFDAAALPEGIHNGSFSLESNDPDEELLEVPVAYTVNPSPILFYLNHRIDDDDEGESQGNGDGNPAADETIELPLSLINTGTITATGCHGVLSSDDPYVTITDAEEDFPDIEPGRAATSLDDFGFTVAAGCPLEHQAQFTLTLTANEGSLQWIDGFVVHITSSLNTVTGQVTDVGSALPIENASIMLTGMSSATFRTNDQGRYFAYGLADGTYTVQASAAGYSLTLPVEVTVPPNAEVNFAMGSADIVPTPDSFTMALPPWGELDQPLNLANPGNYPLVFEIDVDGAGVGIEEEPFGSTSSSYSGSSRMRGNLYEADIDTLLREFRCYLGVDSPATLIHVVYEGDISASTLDKVFEVTVEETGAGTGWYSSGPVNLEMYAGKQYFIGTAWDSTCGYFRGAEYPPLTTSFGTLVDGASGSYPPPATYSVGSPGGSPYYHMVITGTGYWADPEPVSGIVNPASSTFLNVHFNSFDLDIGQHTAQFIVHSNDPDQGTLSIPLTLDVYDGPTLAYADHSIDDDTTGSSDGDGDGHLEAGETVQIPVTLTNAGGVPAHSVIAEIAVNDCPYVTINDGLETFGDIPAGGSAVSLHDFDLTLAPETPTGTSFTVELTIQCADFMGVWHDEFELAVESVSVITGLVSELGTGTPVAGAGVSYSGPVSGTAVTEGDGTYIITGLEEGTYTLMASAAGYSASNPAQLAVPPDGNADFALGASDIDPSPDSFSLSLPPWTVFELPLTLANAGNVPLDYQIEVVGGGVGVLEEIFGDTSSSYTGTSRVRGNVYYVETAVLLREFLFHLDVIAETHLVHSIYQGNTLTGDFNRIFEASVTEPGSGDTWYSSGPVGLELEEGKYYVICCAWDTSCGYFRGPGSPPYPASFGTLESGTSYGGYPPPDPYTQTYTSTAAYHQTLVTGTGRWAEPTPSAGTVAPGLADELTVNFNSLDLELGIHEAEFLVHTNDPDENPLSIPLTLEVFDGPVLAYQDHLVDDDGQGTSVGDGDGHVEPGETVEIPLTLLNSGGSPAQSVTATIEVNNCAYVVVTDESETFGDIGAGGSGVTDDDFDIAVSTFCPSGTTFTVEMTIQCAGVAGVWHDQFDITVSSVSRLAGRVDDVSGGAGIEGAEVSYSGPVSGSVTAGSGGLYEITGLGTGLYTLVASADGYVDSIPVEVGLPPDTNVDFHLGTVDIVVAPPALELRILEGTYGSSQLAVSNLGSIGMDFQLSCSAPWISFLPDSGEVPPDGTSFVTVNFAAGSLDTGAHAAIIQVLSNDPVTPTVDVPALALVYRQLIVSGPGPRRLNPSRVGTHRITAAGWVEGDVEFTAYSANRFGVNVAAVDIDGDRFAEILTGPGPGRSFGPLVRAFELDGELVDNGAVQFMAYGTKRYGVNVGGGDLDGDGTDEILTGAGQGAVFGPHVRAFRYDPVTRTVNPIGNVSFLAYGTNKYGVNIAAGDVDGDGMDEIITGPGPGAMFGPHLRGFNVDGGSAAPIPQLSRFAYSEGYRYGLRVACGDLDGDGIDEIVTGPGPDPNAAPRICGWSFDGSSVELIPALDFFPYSQTNGFGVVAACGDLDNDGIDEILTVPGPGPSYPCHVRGFDYDGISLTSMPRINFIAFDPSIAREGGRIATGAFAEE